MRDKRPTDDREGFTLVETLLALAVLGAAVAGMLNLRTAAVRRAVAARNERTAALIAGRLLTELAISRPPMGFTTGEVRGHAGFRYAIRIDRIVVAPLGAVRRARVEVIPPSLPGDPVGAGGVVCETLLGGERQEER